MTVKIGISADGSIKISTGSSKVRIENLEKWLKRNRDAILVKLQDVEEAIRSLDNRNLWGGAEFPSDDWQYLINREKYWSPAFKNVYRSKDDWADSIKGLNVPFIYTSEKACGHIEGDKSGTIRSYSIPCRRLFEGLEMEYDSHDGRGMGCISEYNPCGIYYLDCDKTPKGILKAYKRV